MLQGPQTFEQWNAATTLYQFHFDRMFPHLRSATELNSVSTAIIYCFILYYFGDMFVFMKYM